MKIKEFGVAWIQLPLPMAFAPSRIVPGYGRPFRLHAGAPAGELDEPRA